MKDRSYLKRMAIYRWNYETEDAVQADWILGVELAAESDEDINTFMRMIFGPDWLDDTADLIAEIEV